MGFVTVNSKSLVVIPKAVRDQASIFPGDKLKVAYDPATDSVTMKKIQDVKDISNEISGIWADHNFKLEDIKESADERINKLLKNKLQQKRAL